MGTSAVAAPGLDDELADPLPSDDAFAPAALAAGGFAPSGDVAACAPDALGASDDGMVVWDGAFDVAVTMFGEEPLVDLTIAIGLMNAFNRIAISFRASPAALAG